jgi:hypothetical protein
MMVREPRTPLFDSHISPSGFEYVMFDSRHVHILPRYVLTINVVKTVGPSFVGSKEQKGAAPKKEKGATV